MENLWTCDCKLTLKNFGVCKIETRTHEDLFAALGRFVFDHREDEISVTQDGSNLYGSAYYNAADHDECRTYRFSVNWCGHYDNETKGDVWDYFWQSTDDHALYHCRSTARLFDTTDQF